MRVGAEKYEIAALNACGLFGIDNVTDDRLDPGVGIDCLDHAACNMYLGLADIRRRGADEPVEVGRFDAVRVDDDDIHGTKMRELLYDRKSTRVNSSH